MKLPEEAKPPVIPPTVPVIKAEATAAYWNYGCKLPHGLAVGNIKTAVEDLYKFFYQINLLLVKEGLGFFEDIMLGNTISAAMSEFLVKRIAAHSKTVCRNIRVGGHPDLIPVGSSPGDSILRGEQGIEVKTSRQPGGWQAHNPEKCSLIVFRYTLGKESESLAERQPIQFVQILAADLEKKDWSLAERGKESRRTRTVSVNEPGVHKLRSNPIYQDPKYVVASNKVLRNEYLALNRRFARK